MDALTYSGIHLDVMLAKLRWTDSWRADCLVCLTLKGPMMAATSAIVMAG